MQEAVGFVLSQKYVTLSETLSLGGQDFVQHDKNRFLGIPYCKMTMLDSHIKRHRNDFKKKNTPTR